MGFQHDAYDATASRVPEIRERQIQELVFSLRPAKGECEMLPHANRFAFYYSPAVHR